MIGIAKRATVFLLLILAITGCATKPKAIFPDAVAVRAYGGADHMGISVEDDGSVMTSKFTNDGKDTIPIPAAGGEYLTTDEIASLRAAISFTKPPEWSAACCIPRHAFLFYDGNNKLLGYLKVCFQCGCAIMRPSQAPDSDHNYIQWDRKSIALILEAHHLPIQR